MSHKVRTHVCEAQVIADHIKGECEHVQQIHDTYGFGCIYPAKHSVVLRDVSIAPSFKKIILRVCNRHFERIQSDDLQILAATKCSLGDDVALRMNFRRNRL